jgi:hypothetical protein
MVRAALHGIQKQGIDAALVNSLNYTMWSLLLKAGVMRLPMPKSGVLAITGPGIFLESNRGS